MKIDDLPVQERLALEELEDDEALERRVAQMQEEIELLEARVRAARLAGA
ncbi:MAG TPA: hypothetical protein VIV54_12410 [Burkholderiales bacterium]